MPAPDLPSISFNAILDRWLDAVDRHADRPAFCIADTIHSYRALACHVAAIRTALRDAGVEPGPVALVANDDIETYASIFALWLEGYAYVPLHPQQPAERNRELLAQAQCTLVLDSGPAPLLPRARSIATRALRANPARLPRSDQHDDALAYILFTSGSTGHPKGVPLSRANLAAFVAAFDDMGYPLGTDDRVLQAFDLTFDLSIMSYLVPLLRGACVYTVAPKLIKYNAIARLLDEYALTFALMVPSTIRHLRPYFDEITLPALRYNLFCGEALAAGLVHEWSRCVPNAVIENVYGPTEHTIFCTAYRYQRNATNKACNGIVSIGTPMPGTRIAIVDETLRAVAPGQAGELCLSGPQLTAGYWHAPDKNRAAFFADIRGRRFYRTGDIALLDRDGDLLYLGRRDSQVKIQGYRVELGEIEHHARDFLHGKNAIAVAFDTAAGITTLALFVEASPADPTALLDALKAILPPYMLPSAIYFEDPLPLNSNGKVDRKVLREQAARQLAAAPP